jgi:hypothetical protein
VTLPSGFIHAIYQGGPVCKVPDRYLTDGTVIPGAVLSNGDIHVVNTGEATESGNWAPCDPDGTPSTPAPDTTGGDDTPAPDTTGDASIDSPAAKGGKKE